MAQVGKERRQIIADLVACERCTRLRAYCSQVAQDKKAAYSNDTYWGKPVPPFGSFQAKLLILGLAPAAHGANRTGRAFAGDRSGAFLFEALHKVGLANQPTSTHKGDGTRLTGALIHNLVACAPPENKPSPQEKASCHHHFVRILKAMPRLKGIVALGGTAFTGSLQALMAMGVAIPSPRPKFGHEAIVHLANGPFVLGVYHPSQQNTFTGRLTPEMLESALNKAISLC